MENNNVKNEVKVKDIGQVAITNMINQVKSFAQLENSQLSEKEMQYAVGIISNIQKKIDSTFDKDDKGYNVSKKYSWTNLDIQGCQLPAQIKRFAKLNLSMENQELFLDIRKNSATGKFDINIKMQYQGLEKLMVRYCSKEIIRFVKSEICQGDKIKEKMDLSLGIRKMEEHEFFDTDDIDYRNKLENITGAYAIAYVKEEGQLVPYVARIDKNRIERARNAATTKNIWNVDTRKMVIKTAVWELFNIMKPYMVMPQDILEDFTKETENDVDFNKDFININADDVKEVVNNNINNSEELSSNFDDEIADENTGEIKDNNNVVNKYLKDSLYDND